MLNTINFWEPIPPTACICLAAGVQSIVSGRIPVVSILRPAMDCIAISVGRIPLQSGLKDLVVAKFDFPIKLDV